MFPAEAKAKLLAELPEMPAGQAGQLLNKLAGEMVQLAQATAQAPEQLAILQAPVEEAWQEILTNLTPSR